MKALAARANDRIRYVEDPRVPALVEAGKRYASQCGHLELRCMQLEKANLRLIKEMTKLQAENARLKRP